MIDRLARRAIICILIVRFIDSLLLLQNLIMDCTFKQAPLFPPQISLEGFNDVVATTYGNIKLRPAESTEMYSVSAFVRRVHLEATCYNEEVLQQQTLDITSDFPELFSEEAWRESKCWICCSKDNSILGALGVKHKSDQTLEISYFYVDKDHRKKGIGTSLLQTAIHWSRCLGRVASAPFNYNKVVLYTLGMLEDAISLYQEVGFMVYDRKPSTFFELVFMELQLGDVDNGDDVEKA